MRFSPSPAPAGSALFVDHTEGGELVASFGPFTCEGAASTLAHGLALAAAHSGRYGEAAEVVASAYGPRGFVLFYDGDTLSEERWTRRVESGAQALPLAA